MRSNRTRLFTPELSLFLATMILANIASRMQGPLLSVYLQTLGAGVGQIGLFFTLASIAPLAFQILGGWISDSIGRLEAVAVGSLAGMASYVIYIASPSWQWLLLAAAANSMASSFVSPSFRAFIAERAPEGALGRVYGLADGLFMIVGVVGPPLGGFISQRYGFKAMYAVAGALYTTASVVRIRMARNARRDSGSPLERPTLSGFKVSISAMASLLLAGGVVTWIMISDGVLDVAFGLAGDLKPIYLKNTIGLSNMQIGWLSSVASTATMALIALGGWVSDRAGERVGIVIGSLIEAASMCVFLVGKSFTHFALAWLLMGVSNALVGPAHSALISKAVPKKLRGTAHGLFSTSLGLVSLPAPYIGALLWTKYGPAAPFTLPIVAVLAVVPFAWIKLAGPFVTQDNGDAATVSSSSSEQ
ncbi:MAG: MFS transporter [Clostridia bacterium]|nr:MFS transporter [Clostridia bacterium]